MKVESKRWAMLAACVVMNMCIGSAYAWSVFQKPLISLYGWTTVEASLAFAIIMGLGPLPMILSGKSLQYLQPKTVILIGGLLFGLGNIITGYISSLAGLYLAYGLVAGLGQGTVYGCGVSNMVRFFPDKRGLCTGVLAAGMGSGALVVAPIAARLIAVYGVLNAFKVLGLAYTIIIVGFSFFIDTADPLFRPAGWVPSGRATVSVSGIEKDWTQMLRDPIFYVIVAMFAAGTISGLMILAHASPILQQMVHVAPQQAAGMVGLVALGTAVGKFGWGVVSDAIGRFPTAITMYVISALCMFGLTVVTGGHIFHLILLGATCFGGFVSMIGSLTADAFGPKNLPINFGVMFVGFSIAAYYGPQIGAKVKMASGGYLQAFVVAAVISGAGIVLAFIAMSLQKRRVAAHAATQIRPAAEAYSAAN